MGKRKTTSRSLVKDREILLPLAMRGKGKLTSATHTDLENSPYESDNNADEYGNYMAFIAISSVDVAFHLEEINEEDGDELEADPTEDEVDRETNFSHYRFSNNEEDGKEELVVI